ncbi:MAG: hypothetical protein ACLP9L_35000 [Thermoguttaceae bacterium]
MQAVKSISTVQNHPRIPEVAMSEDFNPYYQWLGIPPCEQPPHHYRLLGIVLFENQLEVIESAADRQMAHLRTFQTGPRWVFSQKLLNEVAVAKVCLLNPQNKTAYDRWLRQNLPPDSEGSDSSAAGSLDWLLAAALDMRRTSGRAMAFGGRGLKSWCKPTVLIGTAALTAALLALATLVGLAALAWVAGRGGIRDDGGLTKAGQEPLAKAAKGVSPNLPWPSKEQTSIAVSTAPNEEWKSAGAKSGFPQAKPISERPKPEAKKETKTAPRPDMIAETKPAPSIFPMEKTEHQAAARKLALPSTDEQKRLMGKIAEIYKFGEAKDQAAMAALARKLLEDGRRDEANPPEQFALLRCAGEIARDAGEAGLMSEAVDAMVAAGFEIWTVQVKSRLLKRLVEQGSSGVASQLSAICLSCVTFAEDAEARGAVCDALEVLDAANKSFAVAEMRAQTAQRAAKAALARARTLADKAEREKKAGETQGELDEVKSALWALTRCAKGLQQARREYELSQAALERLKTDPDDADACRAVGRWYCLYRGDWDEGLKFLARGSDPALKSLAMKDLVWKPAKTEDRITQGDVWWDLAEKAAGKVKAAIRRRAAHWYEEAMPDLAPGPVKLKVEKRIARAAEELLPEDDRPAQIRPLLAVAPFNEKTAKQHQAGWAKYLGVAMVQRNSIGTRVG